MMTQQNLEREVLFMPIKMASLIVEKVDCNAFDEWRTNGCIVEDSKDRKSVKMVFSQNLHDEIEQSAPDDVLAMRVFEVLEKAEAHFTQGQHPLLTLKFRKLIPVQKSGYVLGRKFATLNNLMQQHQVKIYLDDGRDGPLPDGYTRLVVIANSVRRLNAVRDDLQRLEAMAYEFNPYGLAVGKKKLSQAFAGGTVSERIPIPAWSPYTDGEHRKQLGAILDTIGINWTFNDNSPSSSITLHSSSSTLNNSGNNECTLQLEGEWGKLVLAKMRIGELIYGSRPTAKSTATTEKLGSTTGLFSRSASVNSLTTCASTTVSSNSGEWTAHLMVPKMHVQHIMGPKGEQIARLRNQFDVGLMFLGSNSSDYPNGRVLCIKGRTEQKVRDAKQYIHREFIANKEQAMGKTMQRIFGASDSRANITQPREVRPFSSCSTDEQEDPLKLLLNGDVSNVVEELRSQLESNARELEELRTKLKDTEEKLEQKETECEELRQTIAEWGISADEGL